MGSETGLERLQHNSRVLSGDRNRDDTSGWVQGLTRRQGQGWGRPQVRLIRAFKAYECTESRHYMPLYITGCLLRKTFK